MFPTDFRDLWLQRSAMILKYQNTTKFVKGEVIPPFVECLPYIMIAGMNICNCYFIKEISELFVSQTATIDILLKFHSFRGVLLKDKVNLCERFVKEILTGKPSPLAYREALATVNKQDYNTIQENNTLTIGSNNNNNNNHHNRNKNKNNNNNKQRYNHRRGRGRGGGWKRGGSRYHYDNNRQDIDYNSNINDDNNFHKQLLKNLLFNNNNNNGFTNGFINKNNNNNHIQNKKSKKNSQPNHLCHGPLCSHPQCLSNKQS